MHLQISKESPQRQILGCSEIHVYTWPKSVSIFNVIQNYVINQEVFCVLERSIIRVRSNNHFITVVKFCHGVQVPKIAGEILTQK